MPAISELFSFQLQTNSTAWYLRFTLSKRSRYQIIVTQEALQKKDNWQLTRFPYSRYLSISDQLTLRMTLKTVAGRKPNFFSRMQMYIHQSQMKWFPVVPPQNPGSYISISIPISRFAKALRSREPLTRQSHKHQILQGW